MDRTALESLRPGDRIEVTHQVKVGSTKTWETKTVGTVVNVERRRQGLHYRRNVDCNELRDSCMHKEELGEQGQGNCRRYRAYCR